MDFINVARRARPPAVAPFQPGHGLILLSESLEKMMVTVVSGGSEDAFEKAQVSKKMPPAIKAMVKNSAIFIIDIPSPVILIINKDVRFSKGLIRLFILCCQPKQWAIRTALQ